MYTISDKLRNVDPVYIKTYFEFMVDGIENPLVLEIASGGFKKLIDFNSSFFKTKAEELITFVTS